MSMQSNPYDEDEFATSELRSLRRTLQAFGKSIEAKRASLTAHAAQANTLERDWEDMLRVHTEKRLKLETAGKHPVKATDAFTGHY